MDSIFQFHKGTIRTHVLGFYVRFGSNFNSIKVQLEPNNADDDQLYVGNFNSIKVQLELPKSSILPFFEEFQFHKGTIRTYKTTEVEKPASTISIP